MFNAGEQIYKYQLIKKLGAGGFGQVWLAYDATIDKNMAVKIIPVEKSVDINLFRESRIGSHFEHSNLVKIHYADIVDFKNKSFIVIAMDFLSNGSIISKTNSLGFIEMPLAVEYMRNILFGLDHLHHMSFYHNDIKPNNILIGNAGQAVLTDYGVTYTQNESGSDNILSYLLHRSPETQRRNEVSIATDIYQCGVTAFRLFSSMNYFSNKALEVGEKEYERMILSGQLVAELPFAPYVPSKVKGIIKKAMAHNPAERYSSAYKMLEDFNKIAFPGYWTADANNRLIGKKRTSQNEYSFDITPCAKSRFNVAAYIHYQNSNRTNKISAFSSNDLSKREADKLIERFIRDVIER